MVWVARPVVSGTTVTDGWAVLFPDDSWLSTSTQPSEFDGSIPLQTWIDSEIKWMKVAHHYFDLEDMKQLSPPREAILCYGGPIAKAIVTMMSWRTDDWMGTPGRLLKELSAFRVRRGPQLPPNPFVVANNVALAKDVLADVGIVVERIGDGRTHLGRRASPEQSFSIGSGV